jgi:hypothetical protein
MPLSRAILVLAVAVFVLAAAVVLSSGVIGDVARDYGGQVIEVMTPAP